MNEFKTDDVVVHPKYGRGIVRGKVVGWVEFEGREMALPDVAADLRRLVTIDAEDHEAAERLVNGYWAARQHNHTHMTAMQVALREFSNPKPEEPTGLGAVVEDAEGIQWVRIESSAGWWWRNSAGRHLRWSGVDVVRRLSEGVQESPKPEGAQP